VVMNTPGSERGGRGRATIGLMLGPGAQDFPRPMRGCTPGAGRRRACRCELPRKTLGIWGWDGLAWEVAKRAKGFGWRFWAATRLCRRGGQENGIKLVTLMS